MATFYKGDWVELSKQIMWWKHWRQGNNSMIGKACEIMETKESKTHKGVVFLRIKYNSREAWALDRYCIKVKKYDIIYDESIKRACDQLQKNEKLCKKLRDDILRDVFSEPEKVCEEICIDDDDDELYSDWEDVVTKEMIPLPGKQTLDTSHFIPTEWMTDEELDDYYGTLVNDDDGN